MASSVFLQCLIAMVTITMFGICIFIRFTPVVYLQEISSPGKEIVKPNGNIHLAVVVCGQRSAEAFVMIKSMLLFSIRTVHLHIFVDNEAKEEMTLLLEMLPHTYSHKFIHQFHDVVFPDVESPDSWRREFKPCATERIFFPDMDLGLDKLIYVDTDTIFLAPIDELWDEFIRFNSVHILGVAWHNENGPQPKASFPIYPPYGVNTGIVLMNLPRMRTANWTSRMAQYFDKYGKDLMYGDQDLFNIYFNYYPESLYKLDCKYNYRVSYCLSKYSCETARTEGVSILHGTRSAFRINAASSGFYLLSEHIKKIDFHQAIKPQLRDTLQQIQNISMENDICMRERNAITQRLEEFVQ